MTATTTDTDPAAKQEVWTYIGRKLYWDKTSKPALWYIWRREDGRDVPWNKQIVTGASVGSRYRITLSKDAEDGASIYTKGPRMPIYVGMMEDPEARRKLVALDRAAADEFEGYRKTIQKPRNNEYADMIQVFRAAYRATPASQRNVFIARLVHEITR